MKGQDKHLETVEEIEVGQCLLSVVHTKLYLKIEKTNNILKVTSLFYAGKSYCYFEWTSIK